MRNAITTTLSVLVLAACGGGSSSEAPAPIAAPAVLTDGGLAASAALYADTANAPSGGAALPNLVPSANDVGFAATYSKAGVIDRSGLFFQNLGANGRSCSSCHIQAEGWTVTPQGV